MKKKKEKFQHKVTSREAFLSRPLVTSTPPNFRILPMNQLLECHGELCTQDFKIYEEFCEKFLLEAKEKESLNEERIYQNILAMGSEEEGGGRCEYEIVEVQRTKLTRKPRSLKALRS